MCCSGYVCICVPLVFITQHYLVPVLCADSTLGHKPYPAKATVGKAVASLEATQAEVHEVSKISSSDAEVSAKVTKTVERLEQRATSPLRKDIQTTREKQITSRRKESAVPASTRKNSIATAAPTTTRVTSIVEELTTSTPQPEKEAKAATSAAVVGVATKKKEDQQDVLTKEPDEEEEPEEHIKDTKNPMENARSTIISHLDEKLYAAVSTTPSSITGDDDDMETVSPDSARNLQSPDAKGQSGFHKKKANVGAAVLLVCGIILSLLLSILVFLISMMISAQKNSRLRSTTQSAAVSSAKV